jgi:hypothetical protein
MQMPVAVGHADASRFFPTEPARESNRRGDIPGVITATRNVERKRYIENASQEGHVQSRNNAA